MRLTLLDLLARQFSAENRTPAYKLEIFASFPFQLIKYTFAYFFSIAPTLFRCDTSKDLH